MGRLYAARVEQFHTHSAQGGRAVRGEGTYLQLMPGIIMMSIAGKGAKYFAKEFWQTVEVLSLTF